MRTRQQFRFEQNHVRICTYFILRVKEREMESYQPLQFLIFIKTWIIKRTNGALFLLLHQEACIQNRKIESEN